MREYHDATIDSLVAAGNRVIIEMESVSVYGELSIPDGSLESGRLMINNVTRVLENGVEVAQPTCAPDYGRVFDLSHSDECVTLQVEWQFYNPTGPRSTSWAEYKIFGSDMEWVATDQAGAIG
jgi:hypothetical protein